jgi:hypothetical protein
MVLGVDASTELDRVIAEQVDRVSTVTTRADARGPAQTPPSSPSTTTLTNRRQPAAYSTARTPPCDRSGAAAGVVLSKYGDVGAWAQVIAQAGDDQAVMEAAGDQVSGGTAGQ